MLDKQFITGYWLLVAGLGCVAWYFIIIYFTHPQPLPASREGRLFIQPL